MASWKFVIFCGCPSPARISFLPNVLLWRSCGFLSLWIWSEIYGQEDLAPVLSGHPNPVESNLHCCWSLIQHNLCDGDHLWICLWWMPRRCSHFPDRDYPPEVRFNLISLRILEIRRGQFIICSLCFHSQKSRSSQSTFDSLCSQFEHGNCRWLHFIVHSPSDTPNVLVNRLYRHLNLPPSVDPRIS